MRELDFFEKYDQPVVIALGFFDSLHKGHISLISRALSVAGEINATPCVFTYKNDLASLLNRDEGVVYTYRERLKNLEKLKINTVISTVFTKEFSLFSYQDFLCMLFNNFNVLALVCGEDFKFGKGGLGDVETLDDFCKSQGAKLFVESEIRHDGKKISTRDIKTLLKRGEIEKANQLLGFRYQVSGEVVRDRQVGRRLGFPTANVCVDPEKLKIKCGVYKTHVEIDGITYSAITNYGARPTYNLNEILSETHILGFNGNLYEKQITVNFDKYLRDCVKFESENELKLQLKKDMERTND